MMRLFKISLAVFACVLCLTLTSTSQASFIVDTFDNLFSSTPPLNVRTVDGTSTTVTRTESQSGGVVHFPSAAGGGSISLLVTNPGQFVLDYALSNTFGATNGGPVPDILLPVSINDNTGVSITATAGGYSQTLNQDDIGADGILRFTDLTGGLSAASNLMFTFNVAPVGSGMPSGIQIGSNADLIVGTPEPTSLMMFGPVVGYAFIRRRRKSANKIS